VRLLADDADVADARTAGRILAAVAPSFLWDESVVT
jgi:hypothetical protein